MNYSKDLEKRMQVASQVSQLETMYDRYYAGKNSKWALGTLRRIKMFIEDESQKSAREELFRGTKLNATDCITLATIANLLAARKGIKTRVAKSKNLINYLHAVLVYEIDGKEHVFKLTGRRRIYHRNECQVLSPRGVENMLTYVRPLINVANYLKGR